MERLIILQRALHDFELPQRLVLTVNFRRNTNKSLLGVSFRCSRLVVFKTSLSRGIRFSFQRKLFGSSGFLVASIWHQIELSAVEQNPCSVVFKTSESSCR